MPVKQVDMAAVGQARTEEGFLRRLVCVQVSTFRSAAAPPCPAVSLVAGATGREYVREAAATAKLI